MNGTGPQGAALGGFDLQSQIQPSVFVDRSRQMYDYRHNNTFKSVPVQQGAWDLDIQRVDQLDSALDLKQQVGVWVGYISPQQEDAEYRQQYQQLLKRQSKGQLFISQQDKQFCPSLNKFLIMVTYAEVMYQLNPRYQHLKQEQANV